MKFSSTTVAAALRGRKAIREYPFPGAEGVMCGIKMLEESELDELRLQAAAFCKHRNVDVVLDPDFLDRVIHRMIVARAFYDTEKTMERFFSSHEEVATLDQLLVRTLYELYCAHVQSMDPLSFATEEEVGSLVAALGKSQTPEAILSLFDLRTLRSFALSMAYLLKK